MCVEVVVPEDEWWPTSDCRRRGVCGVQLSWSTGTARTLVTITACVGYHGYVVYRVRYLAR